MTASRPSRGTRAGLFALAGLIGFAALISAINSFFPSRHGPASSSYATTPAGLAAYAELLARAGHPVSQLRRPPAATLLTPEETVVMLDPDALLPAEGRALADFVAAGGILLTGGSSANAFLATILPRAPRLIPVSAGAARPLAAVAQTAGVTVVDGGAGGWSTVGASGAVAVRPVLGATGRPPLLLVGSVGRGQIELLADASPLANRLLASADNAVLGINLAGPRGRPVVFVESVHGYGPARGLAALPSRWWWAAAGLGLAAVAFAASRWRRLGPPSRAGRTLPPARSAYLQAMTAILRRTDDPASIGGLARASGRRLVARRAGLAADAATEAHRDGARRLGLSQAETDVLLGERPTDTHDLMTLGAALARLQAVRSHARRGTSAGRR